MNRNPVKVACGISLPPLATLLGSRSRRGRPCSTNICAGPHKSLFLASCCSPRSKDRAIGTLAKGSIAFTLVELLVVIAILGVLAALLMPTFSFMSRDSNRAKSSGNLRQIGAAIMAYAGEHDGYPPPPKGKLADGTFPTRAFWWPVHLLPYTGGNTKIFDRPSLNKTWNDPAAVNPATGKQFRMGYWINGGADLRVAFPHAQAAVDKIDVGKNYQPTIGFAKPSLTVAIIDGIAGSEANLWNPDSRGMWRSGSNSKYHRWSGEIVDENGLNSQGAPPKGSFNVLWLDGHVSLENSASLKPEDFDRNK